MLRCYKCGQNARHCIQAKSEGALEDEERYILECTQCYAPRFLVTIGKRADQKEVLFPAKLDYEIPDWAEVMPDPIGYMLREVYSAQNSGFYWLGFLGLRSLIDAFALEKVGDVGGFKAKLDRLQKEGFLASKDVLALEVAIELGHDATHRSRVPDAVSCGLALNIVLHLLQRFAIEQDSSSLQNARHAAERKREA